MTISQNAIEMAAVDVEVDRILTEPVEVEEIV